MRRTVIFAAGLLVLAACNDKKAADSIASRGDSTNQKQLNYPYQVKDMPNWERGSDENVLLVLNSLKAYENGNIDEAMSAFADSVEFAADGFYFHGRKDSLTAVMKRDRSQAQKVEIEMHDWESVRGKTNGEEWVSLWYKSKWTDQSGKIDSVMEMDDARIVNGKIRVLDIKVRHYPKK